MNEVKCNNCNWVGNNEDLIRFEDNDGLGNGCPTCETDSYLTDLYVKCKKCGKETTVEEINQSNEAICEECIKKGNLVIEFNVIEDNGYGNTQPAGVHRVDGITLEEAKENIDYYIELYSEKYSGRTETSFFYLENPREGK